MRDPERDAILRDTMRVHGVAAILAWYPEDIVMACGTWPCLGLTLCLYPLVGTPVFYAAANEPPDVLPAGFAAQRFTPGAGSADELRGQLAADMKRLGVRGGDLGVALDDGQHAVPSFPGESPPFTERGIRAILAGDGPRDATAVFAAAAQRKTRLEVEALRRTNAAAGAGLRAFHDSLAPGISEAEVAARVEAAIQGFSGREGTRLARGWAHVQGGAGIYDAGTFSRSSARRLSEGDLVLLELGTCVDGYWSDLTRTAGVGRIGSRQRALLQAVKGAQEAAIRTIRQGVTHEAIDRAARLHLGEKGFGPGFIHACGHHVGFRYHDRGPGLQAGSTTPLAPGMVVTVEPGAYGREYGGGARFEDDVLVGEDGAVVLSPIEISWEA